MEERLTKEQKIEYLKNNINYNCYKKLLDNNFTEKNFLDLYYEMTEDTYMMGNCCIVDKPKGKINKDNDDCSLEVWIHQTTNGGMDGDDFAGDVYIKINDNEYLNWYYSY